MLLVVVVNTYIRHTSLQPKQLPYKNYLATNLQVQKTENIRCI